MSKRTAAYYFLNDNRRLLRIPAHQDVRVVDLYDINKLGAGDKSLPRETVLEYAWQEEVILADDAHKYLECGGTLVFDDRGNLMSWFRKPGTEHITDSEEKDIRRRQTAWQKAAQAR